MILPRRLLRRVERRGRHELGIGGFLTNPFYLARRALHKAIKELAPHLQGDLLDVGCGSKPYAGLFSVRSYTGLEIDAASHDRHEDADVYYDGRRFPFDDGSFDSIVSFQVLEHIFNREQFLKEIHRVLKPGGMFLLTVPFFWEEHEQPWDFARYTSFALKDMFSTEGFEIVQARKTCSGIPTICPLVAAFLYMRHKRVLVEWNVLVTLFLCVPFTAMGMITPWFRSQDDALYLDNILLVSKHE